MSLFMLLCTDWTALDREQEQAIMNENFFQANKIQKKMETLKSQSTHTHTP